MYNQKRKQKIIADKQFQDQIKQVKNYLTDGKLLIERASSPQDFQQALQIFNKAIMKATSIQVSNSYLLYYYRGLCYLNLRHLQKAERDFIESASLADQKGKVQIYNSLGKCKIEMSSQDPTYLQDAIKCYQKSLQYSKNTDADSFLKLAQIHSKLQTPQSSFQAIKYYTNALKFLKPSLQYEAYTERGLCYRQVGDLENSINDFVQACQMRKEEGQGYYQLGVNYVLSGKYEDALEKLDIAIECDATQPKYRNEKGLALYLNGQYQLCLSVYRDTLKLYQQQQIETEQVSQCLYNLGNALMHLNRQQQSIQIFTQALGYPTPGQLKLKILYSQGLAYQMLKNPLSISKFTEALSLIGDRKGHDLYLITLYHLALNKYAHKKYAQAIADVNIIIEEGSAQKQKQKLRFVYQLRGRVYLHDEKYELALRDFQAIVAMDGGYADGYYYLGMCKANLGSIQAAIGEFFKAVQLGSRNTNLMKGISYTYLKAGKPEKALVYINIALEKQPNNEQFLIQRSMVYLSLQQHHKGIQDLTKSLSINNKNPYTHYRRGLAYYKNKQFEQAIQDLKKSLQFQPSSQIESDIFYLIGVSYANKEEYKEAIEPFTNAIARKKVPRYFHERAKCYILLEKNQEALEDLNEVIEQQPGNAFAYFRRGLTYKALKMYEQSAENFMKAREISPDDPKLILNKKQIYQIKSRKLCEPGEEQ